MKILMLVDNLDIGGIETYIMSVSKSMIDIGYDIIICTQGGMYINEFKKNGIKVFVVEFKKEKLINIINSEKVDIIHCHMKKGMILCSDLYDSIKTPYIITLHGLFYNSYELNYSCLKAAHIIVVSIPIKKMLLSEMKYSIENKVSVIYNTIYCDEYHNAIDVRKQLNINKKDKIIIYCSRITNTKGYLAEKFIHAFYEIAKGNNNIHGIVIGDGYKKSAIDFYINKFNSQLNKECMHSLGVVNDIVPYYIESVFVVGTGRVAIEAMNCFKPVIAMGTKSIEGLVTPKNEKTIIESYFGEHESISPKDIAYLVKVMNYLIKNEDKCIELGKWGNDWCCKNFNNERSSELLATIYRTSIYL